VAGIVEGIAPAADRTDHKDTRKGIPSVAHSDDETRAKLVEADPLYSRVICRCELVTEGEIVDAINRPLGATTLDGIKRRVRAGMGRCQAGFCTPLQVRILARELGVGIDEITKKGDGSELLTGDNKDNEPEIRK
jgi:glycerol-3-phosphate dehydrogenase